MDMKLAKNVINGVKLVKVGHFWSKWSKLGHFGGQNDVICQSLGKVVKKIFTVKVSKNYFSQVYGHKFVQNSHKRGKFGQNRSFLVKMV